MFAYVLMPAIFLCRTRCNVSVIIIITIIKQENNEWHIVKD